MLTLRVALLSLGCLALASCGPDAEPCDDNGDCGDSFTLRTELTPDPHPRRSDRGANSRPAASHGMQTAGPITTSSRFHPL